MKTQLRSLWRTTEAVGTDQSAPVISDPTMTVTPTARPGQTLPPSPRISATATADWVAGSTVRPIRMILPLVPWAGNETSEPTLRFGSRVAGTCSSTHNGSSSAIVNSGAAASVRSPGLVWRFTTVPLIGEYRVTVGMMRRFRRSSAIWDSLSSIRLKIWVRSSSRALARDASVCATLSSRSGIALPSISSWVRRRRSAARASSAIAARKSCCASTMTGERSTATGWPVFTCSSAETNNASTSPAAGAATTWTCEGGMTILPGRAKSAPPCSFWMGPTATPAARIARSSILMSTPAFAAAAGGGAAGWPRALATNAIAASASAGRISAGKVARAAHRGSIRIMQSALLLCILTDVDSRRERFNPRLVRRNVVWYGRMQASRAPPAAVSRDFFAQSARKAAANRPAHRLPLLQFVGDLIEPGLHARFVDAGRARETDAADDVIANFDRQPAGNCDHVRQGHLLADHRVVVRKTLGVGGRRLAEAARRVGLAAGVLHRVGACVVAAHRDQRIAAAVDHDGRHGVALGLAVSDCGFGDGLGDSQGEILVGEQIGTGGRRCCRPDDRCNDRDTSC